jgi:putative hydrolase of the HAD superfamily
VIVRGILFDLDETLFSRQAAFWAWIRAEAGARVIDEQRIAELDARGRSPKAALLQHLDTLFGWSDPSLEARLARFRAGLGRHALLEPGLREMLGRLRQRFPLGIVSNGSFETQRTKLETLQLGEYFDPIIISEAVGLRKPDPEIFHLAIRGWAVPRSSVLFVGDDPIADIDGSTSAGLNAVRVCSDPADDGHSIARVTDLESWLEQRTAPPA